jgi:hypothetical protein
MLPPVVTEVAMPQFPGDADAAIAECKRCPVTEVKLDRWIDTLDGFEPADGLDG